MDCDAWVDDSRAMAAILGVTTFLVLLVAAIVRAEGVFGLVTARVEQRPKATFAVVGALGGPGALGMLIALLTAVLAIAGTCLD